VIHTGHDLSKACAMVAVRRHDIEKWKTDLDFLQMLEEVRFHKENFFEKGLIGLCAEGHPGALLFVNRTYNKHRGYGETLEINGAGANRGDEWDVSGLDLDFETMKKVLKAIEKKKAEREANDIAMEAKMIPARSSGGRE
jgi:hypothetical protein